MYGKKSCVGLTCWAIFLFAKKYRNFNKIIWDNFPKKHYLCKKMNDDDFKKRIESEY